MVELLNNIMNFILFTSNYMLYMLVVTLIILRHGEVEYILGMDGYDFLFFVLIFSNVPALNSLILIVTTVYAVYVGGTSLYGKRV